MPLTITFPDRLATTLRTKAEAFHQPVDQFTINFLEIAFNGNYPAPQKFTTTPILGREELRHEDEDQDDDYSTLEELVAKIKATPPDPTAIHPPTDSLLDILLNSPPEPDPTFDPEEWNRQWGQYEVEMKAISLAHEIEEGWF